MIDRRATEREEIDEIAYIAGDGSSIRCLVVNISPGGAAIDVPDPSCLRPRFKLMLEKDRILRNCRLIWRSGKRIGVSFED